MKVLIICFALNSPVVIYEPDELTDAIIVYDYTERPKKCIEVTEPEAEKYDPTTTPTYNDFVEAINNVIFQDTFPL